MSTTTIAALAIATLAACLAILSAAGYVEPVDLHPEPWHVEVDQ